MDEKTFSLIIPDLIKMTTINIVCITTEAICDVSLQMSLVRTANALHEHFLSLESTEQI